MQKIKFIDRDRELGFLEDIYHKSSGLVVIYGRRRVGKTELIKQFIAGKKHLYYLADKRGTEINARNMANLAATAFNELPPSVENFDDVFSFISKRADEKYIVVIDEFSYLVEKDSAIPSIFQRIVDEIIKDREIMLLLSGSSISMMYNGTLSYKSPLYGRRAGEWKVQPLNFREAVKFFPDSNLERAIEFYAIFGNIPAYLAAVDAKKTTGENIINAIMRKGSRLYREPEFLLMEELREPSRYISIFEALCESAKLSEVASKADIPAKDMPKYFRVLAELELVRKETPVTEEKTRHSHYYINDNLFYFYFKFLYPNISYLEAGREEEVYRKIEPHLANIFSRAFEDIVREIATSTLDFQIERAGRWWGYHRQEGKRIEEEIDIAAISKAEKKIALIECKYTNLSYREAARIISELEKKIGLLDWNKRKHETYKGVAAKKIEDKEKLKSEGYIAIDFEDIERAIQVEQKPFRRH